MSVTSQSLLWAAIIIAAALLSKNMGLNDGASMALISGMVAAAYSSVSKKAGRSCGQRCL